MSARKRSSSGGSSLLHVGTTCAEVKNDDQQLEQLESTHRLLQALLQHYRARTQKSVLHSATREVQQQQQHLVWSTALLERCRQLDRAWHSCHGSATTKHSKPSVSQSSTLCRDLLLARDEESGYTPLHWAIYQGNILMILLLLRVAEAQEQDEEAISLDKTAGASHHHQDSLLTRNLMQRPMALLLQTTTAAAASEASATTPTTNSKRTRSASFSSSAANGNSKSTPLIKLLMNAMDHDNNSPVELLADLAKGELFNCRRSLYQPRILTSATGRPRRSSFDMQQQADEDDDEQEEFHVLRRGMRLLQPAQESAIAWQIPSRRKNLGTTYGCEVLTFGRAHHCALGVVASHNAPEHQRAKVRPQRVQAFAQQDRMGGGAVAVAGATHHTLVATAKGQLYAFGLGKGGRLGVGSEAPCALPTRVRGPLLQHRVVAVAAAENHSLCVCDNGSVYAWGSNRFGQVGTTSGSESGGGVSSSRCCVPRRVDDLKHATCVSVAAGERHSVALTEHGEVYVWGENTSGQLGTARRNGVHRPQRVEYLWNNNSPKVAIAISASSQSTLVLTAARSGSVVNSIYGWGHGSHVPSRVPLESRVNPVAIACARFHNVAISADGQVFTWGFHKDTLGTGSGNYSKGSSSAYSAPQLVTGMLTENGGGIAVAVAASENHTAVVTDTGALFTWGATHGTDILGHEGVRWQPDPKRVPGVNRAVAVAAAKEHTILLMGASFPALNLAEDTLENLAARQVAQHVDLFNVLPISIMAERLQNDLLREYCREFTQLNLDGVLNVCQKSVANQYLTECLSTSALETDGFGDDLYHPLLFELLVPGSSDKKRIRLDVLSKSPAADWLVACKKASDDSRAESVIHRFQKLAISGTDSSMARRSSFLDRRRSKSISFHDETSLIKDLEKDLATRDGAVARLASITKEIRAIKKRLGQIAKLEGQVELFPEEQDKVSKKGQLEADLKLLEPALETTQQRLFQYEKDDEEKRNREIQLSTPDKKAGCEWPDSDTNPTAKELSIPSYRCDICKVNCQDQTAYELHMNGRKHRNKLAQVAAEEEKLAAKAMMDARQRQQMQGHFIPERKPAPATKKASAWSTKQTRHEPSFNLPPPPHPVPSSLATFSSSLDMRNESQSQQPQLSFSTNAKASPSSSRSLREIMAEESKAKLPSPNLSSKTSNDQRLLLPAGTAPGMKSPPWESAPVRPVHAARVLTPAGTPSPGKSGYSLGDFMLTPNKGKPTQLLPGSWASPKAATPPNASPAVSFNEIQQQEQEFVAKKDQSFMDNGKWFIERRERAGSFREIEERAAKEREYQLMVDEQREIEKQIEAERKMKLESQKKQPHKQGQKKNRKPRKDKQKKIDGGEKGTTTKSNSSTNTKKKSNQKGRTSRKPKHNPSDALHGKRSSQVTAASPST